MASQSKSRGGGMGVRKFLGNTQTTSNQLETTPVWVKPSLS